MLLPLWPLGLGLVTGAMPQAAPGLTGTIAFSTKLWEGEYRTDVPGQAPTPARGEVWTVAADGSGLRKVVALGARSEYPLYSRDGQWLYFQSDAGGGWNIYRCREDGTEARNLTAAAGWGGDCFGSSLSADGRQIVFTSHDGQAGHVALMNADGSEPRRIDLDGYCYMATLSPDGRTLVFANASRNYLLMSKDLVGGAVSVLTPDHPQSFVPQFTPDGKTIVFLRRDGDLYRMDPDGGHLQRLTEGNGYVEFRLFAQDRHGSTDGPALSPDGKQVAYIALRDGVPQVNTMNVDGSDQRQITHRPTPCGRVRWSPDGRYLAFVSWAPDLPQLFVVEASGGEPRQLTTIPGAVYYLSWKPQPAGTPKE